MAIRVNTREFAVLLMSYGVRCSSHLFLLCSSSCGSDNFTLHQNQRDWFGVVMPEVLGVGNIKY